MSGYDEKNFYYQYVDSLGELRAGIKLRDENGVAYGVKHVNNKPRVSSMPYLYDIAEGNVANHSAWSKIGYNPDIQSAEETVTPQGGVYAFPTAGMQMTLESSDNTQDKAGGTGALTVTIYYLDSNYAEKSETVTLNGTTKADTAGTDIFRVNNMRVATTGTNYKPVGNLSLKGKVDTLTYGYIRAGYTRQRQMVYTVPASKNLYIVFASAYAVHTAANKACILTLRATYDEKAGVLLTAGKFFMPFWEALLVDAPAIADYPMPLRFPAKTDLMVVGSSTGTATTTIALRGWLESD